MTSDAYVNHPRVELEDGDAYITFAELARMMNVEQRSLRDWQSSKCRVLYPDQYLTTNRPVAVWRLNRVQKILDTVREHKPEDMSVRSFLAKISTDTCLTWGK